jgi:benzoyl-CoA 2,3-dioxygenase component B
MEDRRIQTFDDWKDLFHAWQKEIGYDTRLFTSVLQGYEFGHRFSPRDHDEIEFGEFSGERKWESLGAVPRPEIQDLLLRLIAVQGDTEFASVEQQRRLLDSAPSEKDLRSMTRINAEEMRHGWQMSYLLVTYFGDAGKTEARKLLERCADRKERLLGAFNEPLSDWLDFFTYTAFVDRDGAYQLKMLSHSGFGPLARSMGPMLQEESFHLLTGLTGLQRILRAGKVPVEIVQKVINRWLPVCYDLFGHERSRAAGNAYLWGLKGRYDEEKRGKVEDPEAVNETARQLYWKEAQNLVGILNKEIGEGMLKLRAPDPKFHRGVGKYRGERYSVAGELLDESAYAAHLEAVLPTTADREKLQAMMKDGEWIGEGARSQAPAA